ncbi:MAG: hypothetical protein ACREPD_21615 [Stenotrophomonas sp.]|uniref:hypothetical protein n=1 Tax=Stenotrophomonas sp. TaxID=69392 RepID=UPI003D6CCA5A
MAYAEHINVLNLQTLIDLVTAFCAANGWTVERNNLVSTNRSATLRIPGVSDYVHLFNNDQINLRSRVSVGYSAAAAPNLQPNVSPADGLSNVQAGPYPRVKLFANGNAVHVAISTAIAGQYRHHAFGVLDKAGDYVGGTYADGTYWAGLTGSYSGYVTPNAPNVVLFGFNYDVAGCGHVRADSVEDGRSNSFHRISNYYSGSLLPEGTACTGVGTMGQANTSTTSSDTLWLGRVLGGADQNTFSGRSVFHPVTFSVRRAGTAAYLSPIGTVIGTRACSLAKLEPEQEVTIGEETWVVFPWLDKRPMSTAGNAPPASGNYGWAVRKTS